MKLKCIKDYKVDESILKQYSLKAYPYRPALKVGNFYQVTDKDKIGYKIIDDLGRNYWYVKDCFEPIQETRNDKINNLLNDCN